MPSDVLETLSDIDEMSRRRPEVLGFFSVSEAGGIPGWDVDEGTHPAAMLARHCPQQKQEAKWAVLLPWWQFGNRRCSYPSG